MRGLSIGTLEPIVDLALLFFAYSFLGWCIEVTLKYIQYRRFINRGFFSGPLLPIYGCGATLITVVVGDVSRFESAYGTTFALSFALCGAVEYLSSYYMEKRFHARWWDYSRKPMNLHGRVWIGNLALFGLGGVAIVHWINPRLFRLFGMLAPRARAVIAGALLALFAADAVMTHFILKLVKTGVEHSEADNTEEINREIRVLLSDKSVFHRRFAEAYPEVIYRTERLNARLAEIRTETERLRREVELRRDEVKDRIEAGREQLAANLEPSARIKNAIIEKQGERIDRLYVESAADARERALKQSIDADLQRLRRRRVTGLGRK